jgi:hypothetical protein
MGCQCPGGHARRANQLSPARYDSGMPDIPQDVRHAHRGGEAPASGDPLLSPALWAFADGLTSSVWSASSSPEAGATTSRWRTSPRKVRLTKGDIILTPGRPRDGGRRFPPVHLADPPSADMWQLSCCLIIKRPSVEDGDMQDDGKPQGIDADVPYPCFGGCF